MYFKLHDSVKIVVNNGKVKPPFNLCLIICMLRNSIILNHYDKIYDRLRKRQTGE